VTEKTEDFSILTPDKLLASFGTILSIITVFLVGIAAISLVVGSIGIMNTMYTSVLERTKEIGTMKAIGAKNSDILLVFMIESGLLGLLGGIIGAFLGLGLAFLVANIASTALGENIITVSVNYTLLFGAIAFSFAVGLFSGLAPAWQASKLKPVDALRG
jgi:putative ABC transport system permease protein